MNFKTILFCSCAFLTLLITSCEKDTIQTEQTTYELETVQDLSTFQNYITDIEDNEESTIEAKGPGCAEVTFLQPKGVFPNVVTIDFGDGCVGPNGRFRSGKIIIEQSAPMGQEGAERVTTLVDFHINAVLVEGTKILINNGTDEAGNTSFERTVAGGQLTFPNGKVATFDANHTRIQIGGAETKEDPSDDIFQFDGTAYGNNRNGVDYEFAISDPLIKPRNCMYVIEGELSITINEKSHTLDYGEGTCDNLAELMLENGTTITIEIGKRWWL